MKIDALAFKAFPVLLPDDTLTDHFGIFVRCWRSEAASNEVSAILQIQIIFWVLMVNPVRHSDGEPIPAGQNPSNE